MGGVGWVGWYGGVCLCVGGVGGGRVAGGRGGVKEEHMKCRRKAYRCLGRREESQQARNVSAIVEQYLVELFLCYLSSKRRQTAAELTANVASRT